MITLDTSGLIALTDERDPDHGAIRAALLSAGRPYLVPAGILAEVSYFLEVRLPHVLDLFLGDLESGAYTLDCGDDALPRVRQLVTRYADLPLGYADAAVIACAEANGGLVLTLDKRHFGVFAREGTIRLLPE